MKYPIGLPVRCKDNVTRIIKEPSKNSIGCYMCIDPTNGNGEIIYQSWLTPLTEAEYFEEVMKPEGWYDNGEEYSLRHPIEINDALNRELLIEKREPSIPQIWQYEPYISRKDVEYLSRALDHYEALQAIRKFEQS